MAVRNPDAARRLATIKMLRDPDSWPCWPALPLKHTSKTEAAVVLEGPEHGYIRLYHTNMFAGVKSDTPFTDFPSAASIVDAGWVVD